MSPGKLITNMLLSLCLEIRSSIQETITIWRVCSNIRLEDSAMAVPSLTLLQCT
ncbi:hypothetical protein Pint_29419 [Pistacia integerrima]|uniref:Uncharacterized protein n=1 Tax=Pistacia integerrima TaxID=434235 RepID=A0ACC0X1P3_9ROSI|nr:hypothetical protein Pint_29419 [Pistacia integerrima]